MMEWSFCNFWLKKYTWQPAASSTLGKGKIVSLCQRATILLFYETSTCMLFLLCVTSVVGQALTFRIRQNEHNMTAAEVAAKAGEMHTFSLTLMMHSNTYTWALCVGTLFSHTCSFVLFSSLVFWDAFSTSTESEKNFLESETGLKIIQTGVGEVI